MIQDVMFTFILVSLLAISRFSSVDSLDASSTTASSTTASSTTASSPPELNASSTAVPNVLNSTTVIPLTTLRKANNSSNYNSTLNSILKRFHVKSISRNADGTVVYVKKPTGHSLMEGLCSNDLIMYSGILNTYIRKLWDKLLLKVHDRLSTLHLNHLPKYSGVVTKGISFSELKLKKLSIKGMENMKLAKYNLNLCSMTLDIELELPKLELTGMYAARGMVNGKEFNGEGDLSAIVEELRASVSSTMECNVEKYPEDVCKFTGNTDKTDMKAKSIKVTLSSVTYDQMTNTQINDAINEFLDQQLVKSKNQVLARKIVDVAVMKSKLIVDLSPTQLMGKVDSIMNMVSAKVKETNGIKQLNLSMDPKCGSLCSKYPLERLANNGN